MAQKCGVVPACGTLANMLKTSLLALFCCVAAAALPNVAKANKAAASEPTPAHPASHESTKVKPEEAPATAWTIDNWGHHDRHQQLDISLGLWVDSLNPAIWYAIPLAEDGLISSLNDSFDLEFGGLFSYGSGAFWNNQVHSGLLLSGGVRWNFFLTEKWSALAPLKLKFTVFANGYTGLLLYPALSLGALYQLGKVVHLRMEAGNPFGFSLGLAFDL